MQRQIAIDQHAGRRACKSRQFLNDLPEMAGHCGVWRMLRTDVRVVQQIDQRLIDATIAAVCRRRTGDQARSEGSQKLTTRACGEMKRHEGSCRIRSRVTRSDSNDNRRVRKRKRQWLARESLISGAGRQGEAIRKTPLRSPAADRRSASTPPAVV